jgi:NADPH2:quinone reductase
MMKAILCTRFGAPDDLELADLPDPVAGPGEAVIKVEAAALNFFDLLLIAGKYQFKPEFPFSPGAEFAGVVESLGAGVSTFALDDRVAGYIRWGAARERVAVAADRLVKVPAGLGIERASGVGVTYGTSYYALKDRAGLRPGETLVVLGASGGVGLAAVELGKLLGARVIACASSDDKLAFARQHGADETVNYTSEDLRDALKRLCSNGVDVIYDPVGGADAEKALRAMAWEGRYLVIGFAAGENPQIPPQVAAAEELRRTRRVLGRLDRSRAGGAPGQYRRPAALVRRGSAYGPCSSELSAGGDCRSAQGNRRAQGDGQAGGAAVTRTELSRAGLVAGQRGAGGLPVSRTNMRRHQPKRRQHGRGVIGKADHQQHVRDGIERQHEIGQRPHQRGFHM